VAPEGLGLGAFALCNLGIPGRAIAIRSSVVFLVTSAVTVGALSVFGSGLAAGVFEGPHKPLLTRCRRWLACWRSVRSWPFLVCLPRSLRGTLTATPRIASTLTSLAAGIRESEAVLRRSDWRLLGTVGFWIFDVATLADLHRPISPRRGSWPPRDQALLPGRGANPGPAETVATPSDSDAGPDLHSDLPEPFNLATGPLEATKEKLP
jgi:hypothetical protein